MRDANDTWRLRGLAGGGTAERHAAGTDAQLNELHRVWLQVHRTAWRLPTGYPSAPLMLPSEHGWCPVAHPRVLLVQA